MLQNVRIKCIFATRTFSKGKCSASHFTLENVQHQQNVTNAFWLCKNAFDAKMHLMRTFCWCKNAFDAKMHFGNAKQNVTNAFDAKMHLMRTFCNTKCYKCIFATRTFYEVKCSASHFPKENVQQPVHQALTFVTFS